MNSPKKSVYSEVVAIGKYLAIHKEDNAGMARPVCVCGRLSGTGCERILWSCSQAAREAVPGKTVLRHWHGGEREQR